MAGLAVAPPSTATVFLIDLACPSAPQQINGPLLDTLRTKYPEEHDGVGCKTAHRDRARYDQPTDQAAQPILPATRRLWQVPSYRAPLLGPVLVRLSLPDHVRTAAPYMASCLAALMRIIPALQLLSPAVRYTSKQISLMPAIYSALCARSARPCALCLDCSPLD
ncbi:hypothetical protein GGI35DRAFT_230526 [Trichoderma velutinum]